MKVPVVHEAGTERAERVGALHAQHRSGIGVAEVVQAEVVRDGEARDELGRLVRRDVAAFAPDDDRDLALVVQVPAPRRPDHVAFVRVQRTYRLVEVRRRRRECRQELLHPALVVEVDADDLRRLARRQVDGLRGRDPPAVGRHEVLAIADDGGRQAVEQDPPGLHGASVCQRRRAGIPGPTEDISGGHRLLEPGDVPGASELAPLLVKRPTSRNPNRRCRATDAGFGSAMPRPPRGYRRVTVRRVAHRVGCSAWQS